jgi:hypothetical protein
MPAWKALVILLVLVVLVLGIVFYFVPSTRPMMVKRWAWAANGLKPAQSPREAVDGFKKCIRERNYEALATLYLMGDYQELVRKAADPAQKLGQSIDDLVYNVKEVAALNAPKGMYALSLIDPFPKEVKEVGTLEHKEGEDTASILILIDDEGIRNEASTAGGLDASWKTDAKIIRSLVPEQFTAIKIKNHGEKDKSWKIEIPTDSILSEKVDYLCRNYGNFMRACDNLKYSVKHDAATKSDFENQLRTELDKAK